METQSEKERAMIGTFTFFIRITIADSLQTKID